MHNAKWGWMCGFFVVFDLPSVEMLIFSLNFDRFDPFQSLERQFYCHNTGCVWLWGGGSLGLLTLHLPASTLHLCWKKMIFLDIFTSCALPDGIVKKTVVAKTGSKYELKKNFIFWRYGVCMEVTNCFTSCSSPSRPAPTIHCSATKHEKEEEKAKKIRKQNIIIVMKRQTRKLDTSPIHDHKMKQDHRREGVKNVSILIVN